MSKILVLEDSYFMIDVLKEHFVEEGWDFDIACDIARARDLYELNEYDCFIIDLHVDPIGLTKEEYNSYAPYYGWAWFYHYVLLPNEKNKSSLRKKVIIYSKYANAFWEEKKYNHQLVDYRIIGKDEEDSDEMVMKQIKVILKNSTDNVR